MKPIRTLIVVLLISCCSLSYSQIAVVSYMKTNNAGEYLEVEKEWMELHKKRQERGEIYSWSVMQKQFAGSNDEYNFIVVTQYENFAQMDKGINWDELLEGWSDSDRDNFFQRTEKSISRLVTSMAASTSAQARSFSIASIRQRVRSS